MNDDDGGDEGECDQGQFGCGMLGWTQVGGVRWTCSIRSSTNDHRVESFLSL
jgi:hypothetical protein